MNRAGGLVATPEPESEETPNVRVEQFPLVRQPVAAPGDRGPGGLSTSKWELLRLPGAGSRYSPEAPATRECPEVKMISRPFGVQAGLHVVTLQKSQLSRLSFGLEVFGLGRAGKYSQSATGSSG